MTGITSTLNIAKTAIAAQQYGLNVTGHNIANVNNPDYSRQNANHISNKPALYGGFLFGTGVDVSQIQQSVNQLLENRLTDEKSTQAMFEEAESYMKVLEGFFDENSDASMNSIISDYWNAWHDLSDNPLGVSERVQVYEKGARLADRFNSMQSDLGQVSQDITYEVDSSLTTINSLTVQIADLNREILGLEANRTANDLRDQRNSLVDQLGKLINVDVITQGNGSLIINGGNGSTLVNGVDFYRLTLQNHRVMWQGSFGATFDITDDITGGKLAGWFEIRDEVIPKYQAQMDELAREMIWAVNYQNSQGAGLEYYTGTQTGSYNVDDSGWLSSFDFGDKIDYSKDVTLWTEDHSSAEIEYRKTLIDMGVSQASLSNWQGMAPGANQSRYKLTIVDGGDIGDKIVTQTNGDRLAEIWGTSSGSASTALDNVMTDQILTIYGSSTGTHKIDISDSGGDAKRSAASIASALNKVDGITAYASKTEAEFDISGISNAEDGDTIKYSLYVDGYVYAKSFVVDSSAASLSNQFEDSLVEAVNAINSMNLDTDLYADGLRFSSDKGATLGVQDFEVQDNAGIQLDTFTNFNNTDIVTFKITTDGIPTTSTDISIDLTGVSDVTDQSEVSGVFYNTLTTALAGKPFTVEWGTAPDTILIRSTDGSNVTLENAGNDTGNDATLNLTSLSGTSSAAGNTSLEFTAAANDVETFNSLTTSGDSVTFGMPATITTAVTGTSAVITESTFAGAGATTSAVIAGTITVLLDSGMSLQSDTMTSTGLFGTAGTAATASSLITLGGEDGFAGFDAGDTISFDVDGTTVSFVVSSAAGGTTEAGLARQLYNELNLDISSTDYTFIRNGKSVSILKNASLEDPIEITNFSDSVGDNAKLAVSTGTGQEASDPQNDLLESGNTYRDFATSSLYADEAIIKWERFDRYGDSTGASGLLTIEDVGTVAIVENGSQTLSFDISKGALVAGNTLTINTDTGGIADPMDLRVFRQAKSINDIYHFKVTSGGKIGHVPATGVDNLTIEWHSSVSSGTFEIEGHTPPRTPTAAIEIKVDGMILNFYDGTLFEGDVFTITTGESGIPISTNSTGQATGEIMSDWHWTLDSFKDQFNRKAGGMKASVTLAGQLKMEASDHYFDIENIEYSGSNGFSPENTTLTVLDWSALNFKGLDFQFVRTSGNWGILNDTTGGVAQIMPAGGDDDGFKVDLDGNGVGDIEIKFAKKVTGDGYVRFDLLKHNAGDIRYAFGDDASTDSGMIAAVGINTFFKGGDADSMEINENLSDTKYIVSGKIDSKTGAITQGDNKNAMAMADIQHQRLTMKYWEFDRGAEARSSIIDSSLDDYYNTMVGTLGVKARSIKTSREFADIMANQMTEQRDAVSAVSLDEEMIKLMKYQHAFSAASKLLTVADEMLTTLISIR